MGFITWIVVGIIGGWLGRMVIKGEGPGGLIGDLVIGVVGGILGGWIFGYFGHAGLTGINIGSILVAFIGSVVLLLIVRTLSGGSKRTA